MSTWMGFRRRGGLVAGLRLAWLAPVCCVVFGAAGAQAQSSQGFQLRVESLRGQIASAEARHAGAAEMGALWLRLANGYQDELEFTRAEDAFARALRLLRGPETQAAYADALDGMGSLYLSMARVNEARDYTRRALGIYESLGDGAHAAALHERMALQLLFEERYRDAEVESALGLKMLQSLPQPETDNVVSAYLTHSYALCHMGRCGEALEETNRAWAAAQGKLPVESLETTAIWLLRGVAEWKLGRMDVGEQAVREALRLARGLTAFPQPIQTGTEIAVMRQYADLLRESKRKPEAKQMEAEITQLKAERPAGCGGCTVSASALAGALALR